MRLQDADATEEGRQNSLHRGDPWMGQRPDGKGMAPVVDEGMQETTDIVKAEEAKGRRRRSTDGAR